MISLFEISVAIFVISTTITLVVIIRNLARIQNDIIKIKSSELYIYTDKFDTLKKEINELRYQIQRISGRQATNIAIPRETQIKSKIVEEKTKPIKKSEKISQLEIDVLKIIKEKGEVTSSELTSLLRRSREHISRILKSLYEKGYLERVENVKPFRYRVSPEKEEKIKDLIG